MAAYDAVLLHSFGGPEGPDDVLPFLENVTRGRAIPTERLLEVGAHYARFGGVSPINAQNRALVAALREALGSLGIGLPVYWGNRNWHPLLDDTIDAMIADGHRRILAIVTSAFGSYSGCRQYREDLHAAVAARPDVELRVDKVRPYWNHPGFLDAVTDRLATTLASVNQDERSGARLVFTAHSIPTAWATTSPYVEQLRAAATAVTGRVAPGQPFDLAFQSRSGPPEVPWLGPDIVDHLDAVAAEGVSTVVVTPLGFVSDHMEVVYDLDTQAASHATELGLTMHRTPTAGTHHEFVAGLAALVAEHLDGRPPLSAVDAPWSCPAGCCEIPRRPSVSRPTR